jgi:hypothetical protein
MNNKERSLHRVRFHVQFRSKVVLNYLPDYLKLPPKKPTSSLYEKLQNLRKALHNFSVNYLPRLINKAQPTNKKKELNPSPTKTHIDAALLPATKTYVTKIEAVDPKDGQIKTYFGPDIVANSEEEADWLIKNTGLNYCEIVGEMIGRYDTNGQSVPFGIERMN